VSFDSIGTTDAVEQIEIKDRKLKTSVFWKKYRKAPLMLLY